MYGFKHCLTKVFFKAYESNHYTSKKGTITHGGIKSSVPVWLCMKVAIIQTNTTVFNRKATSKKQSVTYLQSMG